MGKSKEQAKGHIVALGGGGFSMEPENPLLDDYILSLVDSESPKVCFVPTASADASAYIVKFYRAFSSRAQASDLTLFDSGSLPRSPVHTSELEKFIAEQDIVYVGGGNTANMLALWRVHGLDRILRAAWKNGAILCGVSAGMICWFEGGITDSFGELDILSDGLGLIPGSACPHLDSDHQRLDVYRKAVESGFPGGYAADDGAALHFKGVELVEVITSRVDASAYEVKLVNGKAKQTRLESRFLGDSVPIECA